VVKIPSYPLKSGDVIGVREKSQSLEAIVNSVTGSVNKYPWLDFDKNTMSGKFINRPERSQIPENIKEQLIVELYSK
jgi:small subunit ribosomal protein S4